MLKAKGFTLIELMIVVAIVGILAAVAYPSYTRHVEATRRTDAQASLMAFAQAMERLYSEDGTYAGADGDSTADITASTAPAPAIFASEAPLEGGVKFYDLVVMSASDVGYEIRAVGKNAQALNGDLRLTSTGVKGWDANNDDSFAASEACWKVSC